jgi:hypothetical protein
MPVVAMLTVQNTSPFDLEFFCAELDGECRNESKVLRTVTGHDRRGRIFLPPRRVNEPLPAELSEFAAAHAPSDAINPIPEEDAAALAASVPESLRATSSGEISPATAALDRHLCFTAQRAQCKTDLLGFNALVCGARQAGVTAMATRLAARYNATLLSIDVIVDEAIAADTPLGQQARLVLEAQQEQVQHDGVTVAISTSSEADAPTAMFGAAGHSNTPLPNLHKGVLPETLLTQLLVARVTQPRELKGVVIDGLATRFAPLIVALTSVLRALGARRHFCAVVVTVARPVALSRAAAQKAAVAAVLSAAQVEHAAMLASAPKSLSEDEYAALSEAEQTAFDASVLAFTRRRQACAKMMEEAERQAEEERRREEIEHSTLELPGNAKVFPRFFLSIFFCKTVL